MKVCVCDIGGTNFRIAVFEDGNLYDIKKVKTPNFYSYNEAEIKKRIINEIVEGFTEKRNMYPEIEKLAVCFPGPVSQDGEVIGSSVIFGSTLSERFFLKDALNSLFPDATISVMNDITAAAYRYMGNGNFCLITVSSGIGNKISIDDKVIVDSKGRTGEIGHYSMDGVDIDVECTCGTGKNHVAMISSGRGVELVAQRFGAVQGRYRELFLSSIIVVECKGNNQNITAEMLAKAADSGDEFATKIIDYCTKPLAAEISLLAIALDIPRFIIIGGFALNCQYYLDSLISNIKEKGIYNFSDEDIEAMIVYGENDDNHGLIGSGLAIM